VKRHNDRLTVTHSPNHLPPGPTTTSSLAILPSRHPMADTRAVISIVLYCLWWPTTKIIYAIQTILSPFWTALQFIFLPVTYLLRAILTVILFPFRLHILERIEVCLIHCSFLFSTYASLQSRTRQKVSASVMD